MEPGDRVSKSALGRAALAGRSQDLSPALRTLLLMIYGDKTASEYSEMASRLPAGRDGFQRLTELGMIEVIASGEPAAAVAPPAAPSGPLLAPQADVVEMKATHTTDEAALQRLLYPEFARTAGDLGFRGMMLQMKVERAMSAADLLALREQIEAAVLKSKGEPARAVFSNRIDFLLSQ
jgi:hypothetical protein